MQGRAVFCPGVTSTETFVATLSKVATVLGEEQHGLKRDYDPLLHMRN